MKITSKNRRGLFEIFIGNIKNEFYDEISVFLTFDISLQVGLSLKNLTKWKTDWKTKVLRLLPVEALR